ncbi:histidine kinase [Pontibacillus litoralis JSM 072002]|uniref:Histidine kinase n=1 Tax=Pontibacillus litoralis JSM 072002 TaxID=1385512 RepID=A0A0A5G7Q9_9BACI|nr:histidine kinase [Pontibacillus litoralis JSM 072002]
MQLERREAEILGFLMDHRGMSRSKQAIAKAVWLDRQVGESTVKTYISRLRRKLSHASSCEIESSFIVTTEEGYEWKTDLQFYVLR